MSTRRLSIENQKSSALPLDYLKMVKELFTTHFDEGLKILKELQPDPFFEVTGKVYPNEVIVCISLHLKNQLAATSIYGSCDFDPKASAPTIQDLLGACVDAIGAVYEPFLDPKNSEKIALFTETSLTAHPAIPFDWEPIEIDGKKVFVKIDKANLKLEQFADEWLAKNDPETIKKGREEQEETKNLFVTGEKVKTKS